MTDFFNTKIKFVFKILVLKKSGAIDIFVLIFINRFKIIYC